MADHLELWDFLLEKSLKVRIRVKNVEELGRQPANTKASLRIVWNSPEELEGYFLELERTEIEEVPVRLSNGIAKFDEIHLQTCQLSWIVHIYLLLGKAVDKDEHGFLPEVAVATLSIFQLFSIWAKVKKELNLDFLLTISEDFEAKLSLAIDFDWKDEEETKAGRKNRKSKKSSDPSSSSPDLALKMNNESYVKSAKTKKVESGKWQEMKVKNTNETVELETLMYFAHFDETTPIADGISSSGILAASICTWLLNNPGHALTSLNDFERTLMIGSLEWHEMFRNEELRTIFPSTHLNIETVMGSKTARGITRGDTHIALFNPGGYNVDFSEMSLSFDAVWETVQGGQGRVIMVNFNRHYFVVKFDADAIYVIDTLGRRLSRDFKQAYIVRFDENSRMKEIKDGDEDEEEMIISGRDCCREFFKRFLAQGVVNELERKAESTGEQVTDDILVENMQISFHEIALKHN